jgi:hypothetical protein
MTLSLRHPFPPMEAMSVDEVPEGKNWQYAHSRLLLARNHPSPERAAGSCVDRAAFNHPGRQPLFSRDFAGLSNVLMFMFPFDEKINKLGTVPHCVL